MKKRHWILITKLPTGKSENRKTTSFQLPSLVNAGGDHG
jgi:hypothetical protein